MLFFKFDSEKGVPAQTKGTIYLKYYLENSIFESTSKNKFKIIVIL